MTKLEVAIRKSIGMRETDQSIWLMKFGKGECNAETLKIKSDESRELFVKDLMRIAEIYKEGSLE